MRTLQLFSTKQIDLLSRNTFCKINTLVVHADLQVTGSVRHARFLLL